MKLMSIALLVVASLWTIPTQAALAAKPQQHRKPTATTSGGGGVYQQCLYQGKVTRWIQEQMPFKVWVSHGLCLDKINDPETGAPVTNTSNTGHWGDAVVQLVQAGQINNLPQSEGYSEDQYRAAVQGILSWQALQKEGLFQYDLTDNPEEADVYVFWTPHFVNKLGLALFENDIRGQTSRWLLPAQAVVTAMQRNDLDLIRRSRKPVVILLRTTRQDGQPILATNMFAAAAHEMGHCLGIDGHSPAPTDLMSVYYGKGVQSANDWATMRYLYRRPAEMIP